MSKNNGGPAFPVREDYNESQGQYRQYASDGMTLRQYYMAHAPIMFNDARAVARDIGELCPTGEQVIALLVDMRAAYADAMIAENAK